MFLANPFSGSKLTIQERFQKEAQIMNVDTYTYWYARLVGFCTI